MQWMLGLIGIEAVIVAFVSVFPGVQLGWKMGQFIQFGIGVGITCISSWSPWLDSASSRIFLTGPLPWETHPVPEHTIT